MADVDSLACSGHLAKVALYEHWAPSAFKAFQKLQGAAFEDGALSLKEKELIAVGCAHVLRCPYCIEHHVKLALEAGATRQEMAESIWVAVAMGAGACLAHASIAVQTLEGEAGDYYAPGSLDNLGTLAELVPAASAACKALADAAFEDGALSGATKELVAIACAHNTRCPFCIDVHIRKALELGLTREQIAEAVWVAIEMGAGACFGHAGLAAALLE
jgi:AhpD family alkylhydroperoxidase